MTKLLGTLAFLAVALAILGAALRLKKRMEAKPSGAGDVDKWPFVLRSVMTKPEQVLYWRLVEALPDHIVLAQVQLSRVLDVAKGENVQSWNNRISRQSYDFVICTKDANAVLAIELDDSSHNRPSRREADAKKDRATAAAGLKLVRWNVGEMPDKNAIRAAVPGLVEPVAQCALA